MINTRLILSLVWVIRCCFQCHLNVTGDRKLVPRFVGPFSIVQQVGPVAYWLHLGILYRQIHPISHVSLFKPLSVVFVGNLHPIALYIDNKQEWEVSRILKHNGSGGRRKYLVAYSEYDESRAFWVPESKLSNALEIPNN